MESTAKSPPTPPPIPPPLASHWAKREKSSTYLASLEAAGPNFMHTAAYLPILDEPIKPAWYFFLSGFAYQVQTTEHEFKLARYETNAYKLHPCRIRFTDDREPRELSGNTFMYAGDAAALQAGRFDRVLWELQMGTRLPKKRLGV
ncbi:hypothetical protein GGS24DRAFT_493026 [Hypoxylon argillaceum]|nr:hypothetical protein GGS24DRAFT_493026 [Hypoxylon argillaceum]